MTVILLIDGEEPITEDNSLFRTSEMVVELLADLQLEDVTIDTPSRYSLVLYIYLDFINKISFDKDGRVTYPDNLFSIRNTKTLLLCFNIESFFADQTFFVYLMRQAYEVWDRFYRYIPYVPDERMIYLYTPYEFVPDKYRNLQTFFDAWIKINANREIVLNGNEVYHTDVAYHDKGQVRELKTYHTINGKKIGYMHKEVYYCSPSLPSLPSLPGREGREGRQLWSRWNFKDGKRDGLQERWYANGQPQYQINYKDGRLDGLHEDWYANGQLWYRGNYKNGRKDGLQKGWYESGKPKYIKEYRMGQLISEEKF